MTVLFKGNLHKMGVRQAHPVQYYLQDGQRELAVHEQIGKRLKLSWNHQIHCIHCGRKTNKSFNQGYCYPCFKSLAQCDICIVSPEKCHFAEGTCREPQWAADHCLQEHFVYLSNTSGVKIGITRHSQIPTRWIDQGAVQAMAALKVPGRHQSGLVEVAFKAYLNDKTNWRNMLKNLYQTEDLYALFEQLWPQVQQKLDASLLDQVEVVASDDKVHDFEYPAMSYPDKINSYNLDKTAGLEDQLMAIKGQYLIFQQGVINIRKYAGYEVCIECL